MRLEEQVISLELAKKLKDAGVKQESYFYWHLAKFSEAKASVPDMWIITELRGRRNLLPDECSAFTVAELGILLPMDRICTNKNKQFAIWFESASPITESIITGETEADARAKMLIHLLGEKGI